MGRNVLDGGVGGTRPRTLGRLLGLGKGERGREQDARCQVGDVVKRENGRLYFLVSVAAPAAEEPAGRIVEGIECDTLYRPRGNRIETFASTEVVWRVMHVPEGSELQRGAWREAEAYLHYGKEPWRLGEIVPEGPLRQELWAKERKRRADTVPDPLPEWIWGVAANIVDENRFGKDRAIRHGIKYFRANQRVWCYPAAWDGGWWERLYVIGRPRDGHGLICVIVAGEQLRNARAKRIYSPNVMRKAYASYDNYDLDIYYVWGMREVDRREAKEFAEILNRHNGE